MSWLEPDRAIVTPGRKQQRLPNLNETHIHPQNSPEAPHTEAKNNTKHEKGKNNQAARRRTQKKESNRRRSQKENRTRRKRLTTSCQLRKKARQQIQGFWATCVVLWLDN